MTQINDEYKAITHEKRLLPLSQMAAGLSGEVVEIRGGHGLARRLEAMGIRQGRRITKISSAFFRGPITFRADQTVMAIGFGMARRILVEVDIPA
jgi:ferrous iron transport protein A